MVHLNVLNYRILTMKKASKDNSNTYREISAIVIMLIVIAITLVAYHMLLSGKRSTDVEITVPSQGIIWATPNGSRYKVTMLDDGTFNKEIQK